LAAQAAIMQGPVVLCYDGSDHAGRAIRRAAGLVRPRHAVLVHVRQTPFEDEVAASGRRLALEAGFEAVEAVEAGPGPAAAVVLEAARDRGASVIAVGPRGRSPGPAALLGGVSRALLDHSDIPVLVARGGSTAPAADEPVFACYDGSRIAGEAIATAAELFAGRSAIVAAFMPAVDDGAVLRSTLPWPVAAEVQDRLAQLDRQEAEAPFRRAADGARAGAAAGFAARPLGIGGVDASDEEEQEPWMRLLRAAASEEAACIVVGHRPSAHQGASTAHGLAQHADRPVLVVPGR
jgi:nucleotide-binding universal stress UspA family protein